MSKFQNMLKDLIKESENSISALSATTGIERSYLSKIISGKRKMSFENFIAIADAVSNNAEKRTELVEAYISDVFGRDKFETYFNNVTGDVINETFDKRSVVMEITEDFATFDHKLELFNFAKFLLSDENSVKRIYTNVPVGVLLDLTRKKEACDFRCIVNTGTKGATVSIFDLIKLNLICCTSYIDEGNTLSKIKQEFYPYVIITDDTVLFAKKDLNSGYYIRNSALADMYAKDFLHMCKYMKINSQIHDDILDVKEPISKYLFNRQVHRILNNNLSVVPFMTQSDWEELARPELSDRGYLINTTYEYYQEFFSSIDTHIFIAPITGLTDFCENGTVREMPVEYSKPLSIETRIALLERIVDYIKNHSDKYKINFLKSNNLEKAEIALSVESSFDPSADCKTTLITMTNAKDQKTYFIGNYLFLSTDKDAVTEYNMFFDLLRLSNKVMTTEESLAALEDRILRLKYNTENINMTIEA